MVLLAKFLLLLFMIIVVHGDIVVDVEQNVHLDNCCNGCCPCNSCEYKCKDGVDGKCRKECRRDETNTMIGCDAKNGDDCDLKCCIETEEGCWNPRTNMWVKNGTSVNFGGCILEICINGYWMPDSSAERAILDQCVKCRAWGEPHFRAFSGATFDWHVPCKHALAQKGFKQRPDFGVFMTFVELTTGFTRVGPTIYKEGRFEVKLDPQRNRDVVMVGTQSTTITTSFPPTEVAGSSGTIYAWKSETLWDYCIWMKGIDNILIELCYWQITIYAPRWKQPVYPRWPGGYPRLDGLCSTNNLHWTLVARNGTAYNPPNVNPPPIDYDNSRSAKNFEECNDAFGKSWQTKWGQLTGSDCPKPIYPYRRKKRDAADPRTVCSDVTISPYHEECHEIIQNSTLTGPDADMFNQTCTFDLCIVDKFVNSTILTKGQMAEGYKQITMQAKAQEGYTIESQRCGTTNTSSICHYASCEEAVEPGNRCPDDLHPLPECWCEKPLPPVICCQWKP